MSVYAVPGKRRRWKQRTHRDLLVPGHGQAISAAQKQLAPQTPCNEAPERPARPYTSAVCQSSRCTRANLTYFKSSEHCKCL